MSGSTGVPISQLPVAPTSTDTDIFPTVQAAVTFQVTRAQIISACVRLDGTSGPITGPLTIGSGGLNVTGGITSAGDLTVPHILYSVNGGGHTYAFSWDGTLHPVIDGTVQGSLATQAWVSGNFATPGGFLPLTGGTLTGSLTISSGSFSAPSGSVSGAWTAGGLHSTNTAQIDGPLTVNGNTTLNATFSSSLAVTNAATIGGNATVNGSLSSGIQSVGGNGTRWTGFGGNNHIAFGWNSATTDVYVDGAHVGNIPFSSSDAQLKNVLGPSKAGLAEVLKVNPIRFTFNDKATAVWDKKQEHVGVLAQDVEKIFPAMVRTHNDTKHLTGTDTVLWALVNAVKELAARVKELEGR